MTIVAPHVLYFQVSRPVGPAPSFCYLLSGQDSSVQPDDGQTLSPLYFPPTKQTLRDILQVKIYSHV